MLFVLITPGKASWGTRNWWNSLRDVVIANTGDGCLEITVSVYSAQEALLGVVIELVIINFFGFVEFVGG